MSQKDVLHIPYSPAPSSPRRDATTEDETPHRSPIMQPGTGPGDTPSTGDKARVIHPVPGAGRYPGVSVS